LSNTRPTLGIPNSIAPFDTSPIESQPVIVTGYRLIVVALKFDPELFVMLVPLGIVAVAVPELNMTGTWRVMPVVLVMSPLQLTRLTHESVPPEILTGDRKSSIVEFSTMIIVPVPIFHELSLAVTTIVFTVF
jgi:hypothetical protein